ncbi:hypothetical protein B0H13DRAFT_1873324 [Mycena leptocephala]|nr:hypothetical protein B0H13DRAFT_1873324 [Mycena leptocephala]
MSTPSGQKNAVKRGLLKESLRSFNLLNRMTLFFDGERLTAVCIVPMEILLIVFGMLRVVGDESAASIFERKAERRRLMQVCPTFAVVCRVTPSLWSNIVVQLPELGRLFHTTEFSVKNQLQLSKNRPLRIVFNAPFTTAPNSERHKIWEMLKLTTVRARWHALYFVGYRHCEYGYSCPHAVFADSNLLLTATNLHTFSLTFENPRQRCAVFHRPLVIDAFRIQNLTCWVPFERLLYLTAKNFLQPPLPRLLHLEITNEPTSFWAHLLNSCTHLETLIWRSTRYPGVLGGSKPSITSLRSLILHNVGDLPPVAAPGITKLVVKDKDVNFTNDIFMDILGSAAAAPAIRELDLLDSPVSNFELASIMDRCKDVAIFRLSSRWETRTEAYVRLTSQALCGYLRAPANRLLEVQFSHYPPSNNRKARAREHFDRLLSVGVSRGLTVTFDVDFYRLKVFTSLKYFDYNRNSVNTRQLAADNDLESALIVVDPSMVNQGQRTVLQVGASNLYLCYETGLLRSEFPKTAC